MGVDLKKYNEFAEIFEKRLNDYNEENSVSTPSAKSSNEKIIKSFSEVKKAIDTIKTAFNATVEKQKEVADTFVQAVMMLMYTVVIDNQYTLYKNRANFVKSILSSDSYIMKLMRSIESYLILYTEYSNTNDARSADVKTELKSLLNELLAYLLKLLKELGYIPSNGIEAEFETDASGDVHIKTSGSRSMSLTSNDTFYAYYGKTNRSGYAGQKADFYFRTTGLSTSNGQTYVTKFRFNSPLLELSNVNFEYQPNPISFLPFLHVSDYSSDYLIDNDGSDEEHTDSKVIDTAVCRFGNIISPYQLYVSETSKQSFALKTSKSSSFTSGYCKVGESFTINKLDIVAKFEDKYSTEKIAEYGNLHFADELEITIHAVSSSNVGYTMTGTLKYDADKTSFENDMNTQAVDEETSIKPEDSYFTGTLKLKTDEEIENENSGDVRDATTTASSYQTSKDVVLCVKASDTTTRKVICCLDDSSDTNGSYADDENNPLAYLPTILASFEYGLTVSNVIKVNTDEYQLISALGGLASMSLNPFDPLAYSKLISIFELCKENLIKTLIKNLNDIDSVIYSQMMAKNLFTAYDTSFSSTYTDDLYNAYNSLESAIQQYTSSVSSVDLSELYNGTFVDKFDKEFASIKSLLSELISDTIESEDIYHNLLNTAISGIANNTSLSFESAIYTFYNVITGSSLTLSTASSTGTPIYTFNIRSTYQDFVRGISASENYKYYTIESYMLQYVYVLLASSKYVEHFADIKNMLDNFLGKIILRIVSTNVYNSKFDECKPSVTEIVKTYIETKKYVECESSSFNRYNINPYFYSKLTSLKNIDYYDIDDLFNRTNVFTDHLILFGRSTIYKAILEHKDIAPVELETIIHFALNGQKLNARELVFIYTLINVAEHINQVNPDINIDLTNVDSNLIKNRIIAIKNYVDLGKDLTSIFQSGSNFLIACQTLKKGA